MTTLIAITGGIGSGKSTFSKEVKKRGFRLFDSDEEVSKLYSNPDKKFINLLKKINLGETVIKGKIDKNKISKIMFVNNSIKSKLENYIFKIIRRKRKSFISDEKKNKEKFIFFDIPLLFENSLQKDFDIIISIISIKKERFKRLKKSKNMSKKLFNNIIKNQTTDLIRRLNSNIIIINNNSFLEFKTKVNRKLDILTK